MSLHQLFCGSEHFLHVPAGFPIVGEGGAWGSTPPPSYNFFEPPHQNQCPPWGAPPPLKNEASLSEKQTFLLKRETSFHEMILRKSTINHNLKSS